MNANDIDQILDKLAKDVEAAVHALYRGEVRQATVKARTGHLIQEASAALTSAMVEKTGAAQAPGAHLAVSPRPSVAAPVLSGAAFGWTKDDSDAVLKCINAWLPVGGPSSTAPDTKCIAAGKVLVPTWGERERAREAVKRTT